MNTESPERPLDDDPTGMRRLLSSLPDPGPMPDDLVARIQAALADEARLLAETDGLAVPLPPVPPVPPAPHPQAPLRLVGGTPVSAHPDAARRHRPPWGRYIASAAAVLVLGAGALSFLNSRFDVGATSMAGGRAEAVSASTAPAAAEGAASPAQQPSSGAVEVSAEVQSFAAVDLARAAARLTASQVASDAASLASPAAPQPLASAAAANSDVQREFAALAGSGDARACADRLGVAGSSRLVIAPAVVDGVPAAVLVATASDGRRTAWAVRPDCATVSSGMALAGPVVVP